MFFLITSYLFLLGAVVGSFLNVVATRWGTRSFVIGRSSCPHCSRILGALELIPLVSYIIQRGRCKACNGSLSLQYPAVELLTGVVFAGVFAVLMPTLALLDMALLVLYLVIACVLIIITLYDLKHLIIPDELVFTFIALTTPLLFIDTATMTLSMPSLLHVLAGPALFAPFFALWLYSKGEWIGLGDGKLAWGIGWMLGMYAGVSAVIFAFWIGAAVALLLMAVQRMRVGREKLTDERDMPLDAVLATDLSDTASHLTMKSEIPFGPFLIIGTALVFVTGWTLETVILFFASRMW